MTIDVYTATGTKKGTANLPKALFEAAVNEGLMHQAVVRAQANRRRTVAHVKTRGEVQGSTKKLFRQKGTGRARRGSVRAPLIRGGGKAFGPRNEASFAKNMPKKMRRAALASSLTAQAQNGVIIGLENYPETIKTKDVVKLIEKLPVDLGRKILFVLPEKHQALELSARNVPGVKTITAQYLNAEDVLGHRHIVFMVEALKKAEEVFGGAVGRGSGNESMNQSSNESTEKKVKKASASASDEATANKEKSGGKEVKAEEKPDSSPKS